MTYFVLYSTCQTIKDYLIGFLLYFYKNKEEEKCHFFDLFPTFTNPRQINKTLASTLTLIVLK